MPLIPNYPRCPKCDGQLPIQRLYREAPTWRGVILKGDGSLWAGMATAGNTGIVCPTCHSRLLVLQGRAVVANILISLFGYMVLLILWLQFSRPLVDQYFWAFLASTFAAVYAWTGFVTRYQQRFVRLRPLEAGEHAAFPLTEHLSVD
jgi:hypothetical protein